MGTLWFGIFLQLFLILGVLYTLASDSIAMHRLQIAVFGGVATIYAVQGVNAGIFAPNEPSMNAMSAGWLVLAFVDILWVLYFTSEEDSLTLYVFNSLGTGGLTPPSRRRRTRPQSTKNNSMAGGNGYNYASGIGSQDIPYDPKIGDVRSQHSFNAQGSLGDNTANRSFGAASNHTGAQEPAGDNGSSTPKSPLLTGIGAGSSSVTSGNDVGTQPDLYQYKAKALYACTFFRFHTGLKSLKKWCIQTRHHLMIRPNSPLQKGRFLMY